MLRPYFWTDSKGCKAKACSAACHYKQQRHVGVAWQGTGRYRLEGIVDEGVDALGGATLRNGEQPVHAMHIQQHAMRLQVRGPRQRPQKGQQRGRPGPSALASRIRHLVGSGLERALQRLLPAGGKLPAQPPLVTCVSRAAASSQFCAELKFSIIVQALPCALTPSVHDELFLHSNIMRLPRGVEVVVNHL